MRGRILRVVERLRAQEIAISVAESMDALAAVGAVGIERPLLREALAATLVKDERDREAFDAIFDVEFPLVGSPRPVAKRKRRGRGADGAAGAGGSTTTGARGGGGRSEREPDPASRSMGPDATSPRDQPGSPGRRDGHASGRGLRASRRRALLRRPMHALDAREVEESRELVRELGARLRGRLARRERHRRAGRLDVRRMLRAAASTAGVPVRLVHKSRRPGKADLVALVDLSGSVATASELCLGLVAPAVSYFRRVHTFAYVDRLCPITFEHGHLTPDGPLDLYARSDFGAVLGELVGVRAALLGRQTLLLVVGDARNNRRPHRADLLRRARDRVQRLVWLVPEPRARWNTGDSVLDRYAPVCDAVFECESLGALLSALRATL